MQLDVWEYKMRLMLCHSGQRVLRHTVQMRDMLWNALWSQDKGFWIKYSFSASTVHLARPLGSMIASALLHSSPLSLSSSAQSTSPHLGASALLLASSWKFRRWLHDCALPCLLWWLKYAPAPSSQQSRGYPLILLCCLLQCAPPGHCCSPPLQ